MEFVEVYWRPKGAICGDGATEGFESGDDAALRAPPSITKKSLIIWVKRGCMSCQINKPFFALLESQAKVQVYRVEASEELRSKFPHVTTLPMYDIVEPAPSEHSPYGPGTRLVESIRNDRRDRLAVHIVSTGS